jgi:hypothetical protein
MTDTPVSAALGLIGYATRIDDPVSATTAAELATDRLDRDDLESVLRLIWPSMAELHACFSPVPAPTSGPRRRGVQ